MTILLRKAILFSLSKSEQYLVWLKKLSRIYDVEEEVSYVSSEIMRIRKKVFAGDVREIEKDTQALRFLVGKWVFRPGICLRKLPEPRFSLEEIWTDNKLCREGVRWRNPDLIEIKCAIEKLRSDFFRYIVISDAFLIFQDGYFEKQLKGCTVEVITSGYRRTFKVRGQECRIKIRQNLYGAEVISQQGKFSDVRDLFEVLREAVEIWDQQKRADLRRERFYMVESTKKRV
ncbi:hypothetical protein ACFL2R_00265 [Patescibacteria group bacterium]